MVDEVWLKSEVVLTGKLKQGVIVEAHKTDVTSPFGRPLKTLPH
jgi:hypothetical protein